MILITLAASPLKIQSKDVIRADGDLFSVNVAPRESERPALARAFPSIRLSIFPGLYGQPESDRGEGPENAATFLENASMRASAEVASHSCSTSAGRNREH